MLEVKNGVFVEEVVRLQTKPHPAPPFGVAVRYGTDLPEGVAICRVGLLVDDANTRIRERIRAVHIWIGVTSNPAESVCFYGVDVTPVLRLPRQLRDVRHRTLRAWVGVTTFKVRGLEERAKGKDERIDHSGYSVVGYL
jgi:hypothetical protein